MTAMPVSFEMLAFLASFVNSLISSSSLPGFAANTNAEEALFVVLSGFFGQLNESVSLRNLTSFIPRSIMEAISRAVLNVAPLMEESVSSRPMTTFR